MNLEFFKICVQLIVALGITLGLMFLTFRVFGSKINDINNNKYVKVIERVQVTKENSIITVKVGKKGYVMTTSAGHMEKLSELSEEEINNIEEEKKKINQDMAQNYYELISKLKKIFSNLTKNKRSKEEKHEK